MCSPEKREPAYARNARRRQALEASGFEIDSLTETNYLRTVG